MQKFISLLILTLALFACDRQDQTSLATVKLSKDQEVALAKMTQIAAKYGLEDSVNVFMQPSAIGASSDEGLNIPDEVAEAWLDEFFKEQRKQIDNIYRMNNDRQKGLEALKQIKSVNDYFSVVEQNPYLLEMEYAMAGGKDKYNESKVERLIPGKYHIYLDNEGAVVWQPASEGNYIYGTRLDTNN